MDEFEKLYQHLHDNRMSSWVNPLKESIDQVFTHRKHGKWEEWQELLSSLPHIETNQIDYSIDTVTVGRPDEITSEQSEQLLQQLKQLHPWRKGPFELFGTHIDTEWRSDWKWQRLEQHISPLKGKRVLDIGCGSGYHAWRMLGAEAKLVIGADPSQFFLTQFLLIKHFVGDDLPIHFIPLKSEEVKGLNKNKFDTVFSMGVLYHRRSPIDHLYELKSFLRPGGELVLETLVVDGDEQTVLIPEDRYGKMRNVWFIPSPDHLCRWLERSGFINIRVVDVTKTTLEEQRATEWMTFESLPDFLDPDNPDLTIEGYSAPTRATVICNLPS